MDKRLIQKRTKELLEKADKMVKFVEIEAKSILTKHRFRDDWFWDRYAINPYRGCQFACNYCDAITEKYLVLQSGSEHEFISKNMLKICSARMRFSLVRSVVALALFSRFS